LQGAGYSLQIGSGIADNDAGSGILFTVLTAPIFGLVGAAVGAATTRK
jgi:hypothetical protein